jgi:tRNA pseudouridine38-40 synthase
MKLFIKIKYDGSAYAGYQVQSNAPTIQNELNKATSDLFGVKCDVTGCSRTDAGVHAKCFCATVQVHGENGLNTAIPVERIPQALNVRLPEDISVYYAEFVSEDFHARYSVVSKTYEYRILNAKHRDPFLVKKAFHYAKHIEEEGISLMQKAAANICGEHDFAAFMASGSKVTDTVRTVYFCEVNRRDDEIIIRISANGFLYNMVRIICGTLLDVAKGDVLPDDIVKIIESKDRRRAGATLPPDGLYLVDVKYR